ncbi:uncharacterized protein LOC126903213 [Daktulosphaira vitifoliae]|uniref:uncharacterized protein LOC126903213 n=1 Tax=Daktulosphaira vitifoliae TaxID=58002 RepID=UPI0021AA367D|nr:uncharacterized protein LOC126903213 [Daktulosphaira vitifoliae]XP_050537241.1 uncharacterized protein LOC126903213 [Daktulosphaira vitifoliae]
MNGNTFYDFCASNYIVTNDLVCNVKEQTKGYAKNIYVTKKIGVTKYRENLNLTLKKNAYFVLNNCKGDDWDEEKFLVSKRQILPRKICLTKQSKNQNLILQKDVCYMLNNCKESEWDKAIFLVFIKKFGPRKISLTNHSLKLNFT